MIYSKCTTEWCNYFSNPVSELYPLRCNCLSPSPNPRQPLIYLILSSVLFIHINEVTYHLGFLCLASFIPHKVFRIHPHCSMYQYFILNFLLPNNSPLYGCNNVLFTSFQLMDVLVVSTLWLLWIMLYIYVFILGVDTWRSRIVFLYNRF